MSADNTRWTLIGLHRFPHDSSAASPVAIDDPMSDTVAICAELTDSHTGLPVAGPILFEANCDRFGYVDEERGEREYADTVARSQAIVDWHNSLLGG